MSSNVILIVVKTVAQQAQKKHREIKPVSYDQRLALEKKEKILREIQNLAARRQLF